MKIVNFKQVAPADWDRICDSSSQAWWFHRSSWIDLESAHFVTENLSFALSVGQDVVAVQPLYLSDARAGSTAERLLHSGIHRHTGLAIRNDVDASAAKAARSIALGQILSLAERLDVDRIQLNVHNLTPESLGTRRQEIPFWVREHGFYLGLNFSPMGMAPGPAMSTCAADQILDLARDESVLFMGLDEACRRAIRRATDRGLQMEIGASSDCVVAYYELAQLSARRTGEAVPSVQYYKDLWDRLQPAGSCLVLFAIRNGRKVAGLILLVYKGSASFLAGVSDPEALSFRVNDFLHWSAILWAKRSGLARYRLGPIFPEVPYNWPIARVSRFKGKFGCRSYTTIQGSYFRHPEKYLEPALGQLRERCARRETQQVCGGASESAW
ncbi:MAG: lipid II:glycine glycyltransferase FemX [Gammaproteobacteria bacterium]